MSCVSKTRRPPRCLMNLTGENRGGPTGKGATPQAYPTSRVRQAARVGYRSTLRKTRPSRPARDGLHGHPPPRTDDLQNSEVSPAGEQDLLVRFLIPWM